MSEEPAASASDAKYKTKVKDHVITREKMID